MEEILMEFFRDANSYQSIDPPCFKLEEYTEYWIERNKQQFSLQGVGASKPTSKDVLNKAVSAIYFNDNSDYLKALYGIVNDLTDLKEPIDIRSLYKSLNPD